MVDREKKYKIIFDIFDGSYITLYIKIATYIYIMYDINIWYKYMNYTQNSYICINVISSSMGKNWSDVMWVNSVIEEHIMARFLHWEQSSRLKDKLFCTKGGFHPRNKRFNQIWPGCTHVFNSREIMWAKDQYRCNTFANFLHASASSSSIYLIATYIQIQ